MLRPDITPGHTCDHVSDFASMEYPLGFSFGSSCIQWNLFLSLFLVQLCRQVHTGYELLMSSEHYCKYIRLQLHCYALRFVIEDALMNPWCDFVDALF